MSSEEFKNKAAEFIEESQIKDFFSLIDQLEFTNWLSFLFERKNKKTILFKELVSKNDFWCILPASKHFSALAQHDFAEILLVAYFKKPRNVDEVFNLEFTRYNPSLFIKSFNSSRKFFNFKFIQAIKHLQSNEDKEVASHAKFWEHLYKSEQLFWTAFEQDKQLWLQLNPIELLTYCCYYLENKEELLDFTFLNVLLSLYFFEKRKNNIAKEVEGINADILTAEILFKCLYNPNNDYFRSLSKLESWFLFVENAVNTYAYAENFFLSETDYYFHLNCKDNLVEAKWRLVGKKIELLPPTIELNNKLNAEFLIKAENIQPAGKNEKEKKINAELDRRIQSSNFLLNSMQLTGYQVAKTFVPIFSISTILNLFIENANKRYVEPLREFKENYSPTSQLGAIIGSGKLQESRQQVAYLPIRTDTSNEFIKLIGGRNKYIDETIQILCFDSETACFPKYFNRFNPFVKIGAQPFFKIGDSILSFRNVMGALHNSFKTVWLNTEFHRKNKLRGTKYCFRTDSIIEQEITDFEIKVSQQFSNLFDCDYAKPSVEIHGVGEIDLLVRQGKTLMLVEFKRTIFKTSLSHTFFESKEIHQKGAKQLNRLVAFFQDEGNHANIKKDLGIDMRKIETVLPLLISTSLEQDGEMIDGILKQNFFQFNFHSQHMDWRNKSPLETLYNNLQKDVFWKELTTLYQDYEEPLPGYDARLSFVKGLQGKVSELHDEHYFYDLGNKYYHQQDFNNAIVNFEKAKQLNPKEAEYLASIANCLAEMGQALIPYEEALAIRRDSFIWKNFQITLTIVRAKNNRILNK